MNSSAQNNPYKNIFFLGMIFILSSCGFHLRGYVDLAPALKRLYLETKNPYGELTRNLIQGLKASNVVLTKTPEEAATVLEILSQQETQQLLSVSGTQQTRQYNLNLIVVFQITTPAGKILLPPQTVTETRTATIRADQFLGGSNEKNNLYTQMHRDIVISILNKLAAKNTTNSVAGIITSNEITH